MGAELARFAGLRVLVPVAARLAIVLAILHALLEVHLIVVALSIVAALLIVTLLCGKCGGSTSRTESGARNPKSQHPHGLF